MRRFMIVSAGSILLCSFLAVCQTASAFIIDTFDTVNPQYVGTQDAAPQNVSQSLPLEAGIILGGERDINILKTFGNSGRPVGATILPGDGLLNYGEQFAQSRGEMWMTWDGADGLPLKSDVAASGLNVNLEKDFDAYLTLRVLTESAANNKVSIQLWDRDGKTGTDEYTINGDSDLKFYFSDFTAQGVDVTRIGAIQLGWVTDPQSPGGVNAQFDWFGTGDVGEVPEPGTMVIMGALLGLGAFGRLRKRLTSAKQTVAA